MDPAALGLALAERQRIKDLTTVGLSEVLNTLSTGGRLDEIPSQMLPFLELSSTSGVQDYDDVRMLSQMQTGSQYPTYQPTVFIKPSSGSMETLYGGVGSVIKSADIAEDALFSALSGVVEKAIFSNWRDQVVDASINDMVKSYVNVILSPNACAWCRWLKAEDFIAYGSNRSRLTARYLNQNRRTKAEFHDNCDCTYGLIVEAEDANKYEQPGDRQFYEVLGNLRKEGASGQEDIMRGLRLAGYR